VKNDEPYLLLDTGLYAPQALRTTKRLPAYVCPHCKCSVMLNPTRQRERAHCKQCERTICDDCAGRRALGFDSGCGAWRGQIDSVREITTHTLDKAALRNRPVSLAGLGMMRMPR
jgi:hypothetical protein